MSTIFILLMAIIIIACILLAIIILAQNPKGGGLSGTFGGASSAS
ncbi:MAG: preprotein translocase subunit SecG, partial [Riemerella sp.]|nr:preprotein translocase subunit SecG [Riemerella sp.]